LDLRKASIDSVSGPGDILTADKPKAKDGAANLIAAVRV
jgi:hypothetical protein